jgi:hypothetical protein
MAIITGSFTSLGTSQAISVVGGVTWMQVTNQTNIGVPGANLGTSFIFNQTLAPNDALITCWNAGGDALINATALVGIGAGAVPGFLYLDDNVVGTPTVGVARALNSASNGGAGGVPRLILASIAGLANGDIIRIYGVNVAGAIANTGIAQFNGQDFQINNIGAAGNSVDLPGGPLGIAAAGGPPTSYRVITGTPVYNPYQSYISAITQAVNALVTTTTPHGLQIGQKVRFNVNSRVFGMTQINGLSGSVLTVPSALTFTVDINTTGFNAFTYPTSAVAAVTSYTDARIAPFGENTATALNANVNILGDSLFNAATTAIVLGAGPTSPAGEAGNIIEYVIYTDSLVA